MLLINVVGETFYIILNVQAIEYKQTRKKLFHSRVWMLATRNNLKGKNTRQLEIIFYSLSLSRFKMPRYFLQESRLSCFQICVMFEMLKTCFPFVILRSWDRRKWNEGSLKTSQPKTYLWKTWYFRVIASSYLWAIEHRGPGNEIGFTRGDVMRRTCFRFEKSY